MKVTHKQNFGTISTKIMPARPKNTGTWVVNTATVMCRMMKYKVILVCMGESGVINIIYNEFMCVI